MFSSSVQAQGVAFQPSRGIPKPILLGFLIYLGTLMATQTAYGWSFMPLRWVGLIFLTAFSGLCWLFDLSTGRCRWDSRGLPKALLFFLAVTLVSVFASENFSFSGLRWLSNAMLLLTCIVFLRGVFTPLSARQMIQIIKGLVFFLLLIAIIFPAPHKGAIESPYFRGAMNDPNSLGHVSVIAALVFIHGALTSPSKRWRQVQGLITALSLGLLLFTFARSSMVAFLTGILLLRLYYGVGRSLLAKAAFLLLIALVLASPIIQTKISRIVEKDRPHDIFSSTIIRLDQPTDIVTPKAASIFISRKTLWSDAWEGFLQRPLQGWGFSMNKDTPKTWTIGFTSIGMIRDATNDILFILEGSGLFGIIGFAFLAFFIWRQGPTASQRKTLQAHWGKKISSISAIPGKFSLRWGTPMAPNDVSRPLSPTGPPVRPDRDQMRDHTHAIAYILSVSLWVLFLFDGSAFSPGSLISAVFWIATGISAALWAGVTDRRSESQYPTSHGAMTIPKPK